MAAPSIFSRIIAGEVPCHRVFENEHVFAFLDINPLASGHTLVVPRRQVERLEQLEPAEAAELMQALIAIARKVLAVTGAAAYNVLQNNGKAAGQEVAHVHFHIIPRAEGDGLGYRWKPTPTPPETLAALAERIRRA
jgi:histidine triad (HIT) family protein